MKKPLKGLKVSRWMLRRSKIKKLDVVRTSLEKGGTFKFKNSSSIFRTLGVNNAYQQEPISGIRYLLPYFLE